MLNSTKEYIQQLLLTNDTAVGRALIALNERQTASERGMQVTVIANGVGFKPSDAFMGTSCARPYTRIGFLSPKQLSYWRAPAGKNSFRIGQYHRQLIEVAKEQINA